MLKLQKEFTKEEQKYLKDLYGHPFMKKFLKFQKDFLVDKQMKSEIEKDVKKIK